VRSLSLTILVQLTLSFRYLRALASLYIRMTFRAVDVYELLEPLLKDYRKLRERNMGKHNQPPIIKRNLVVFFSRLFLGVYG